MNRALLILAMDFIVATVFFYVTEPEMPKMVLQPIPSQADASDAVEAILGSESDLEKAWDQEL